MGAAVDPTGMEVGLPVLPEVGISVATGLGSDVARRTLVGLVVIAPVVGDDVTEEEELGPPVAPPSPCVGQIPLKFGRPFCVLVSKLFTALAPLLLPPVCLRCA